MTTTKQVKVMRGISGSGKSTLAKKIHREAMDAGECPLIVSADDFFLDDFGEYKFDVAKLDAAHKSCLRIFLFALKDGMSPVIVDNTNINIEDLAPYVAVGQALGYEVEILQVDTPLEVAKGRNVHGVSDIHVEGMAKRMQQTKIPKRFKITHIKPE